LVYAFLSDAYREEKVGDETRVVLGLDKRLAPFRFAVLPLSKQESLINVAKEIHGECLKRGIRCDIDVTQSIGKRSFPFILRVSFHINIILIECIL
jgi:glycyl-tRNA synthetase